jgi:hypothetical protein
MQGGGGALVVDIDINLVHPRNTTYVIHTHTLSHKIEEMISLCLSVLLHLKRGILVRVLNLFISSVFKENVSELGLHIINLQTDLPMTTRVNGTNMQNLVSSAQCPIRR